MSIPRQADVLLSPASIHMSPLHGETRGREVCNWITEGTRKCGNGRKEAIRSLIAAERVKTETNTDNETGRVISHSSESEDRR